MSLRGIHLNDPFCLLFLCGNILRREIFLYKVEEKDGQERLKALIGSWYQIYLLAYSFLCSSNTTDCIFPTKDPLHDHFTDAIDANDTHAKH